MKKVRGYANVRERTNPTTEDPQNAEHAFLFTHFDWSIIFMLGGGAESKVTYGLLYHGEAASDKARLTFDAVPPYLS